jgi:hypothetical protein
MKYILYNIEKKRFEIIPINSVINSLYYLKMRVPTRKDITDNLINKKNNIIKYFENKDIDVEIQKIKDNISKIEGDIPLYNINFNNLYLINKYNIYNRVVVNNYKFPNDELIKKLKKKKNNLQKNIDNNKKSLKKLKYDMSQQNVDNKIIREYENKKNTFEPTLIEYEKMIKMLNFLDNFNIKLLYKTYIYLFYKYSNEVGKNITLCEKPSFIPYYKHIKPYYSRSELINLALNMELMIPNKIKFENKNLNNLCLKIMHNDINKKILLSHKEHIINNNSIGVIQYYTLQGSYFMNEYLRLQTNYNSRNYYLEENIKSMWNLVNNSPPFDKSYILYRFIKEDNHLHNLKVNDTYITPSFMSMTRDPFYNSDSYQFGFILIKVKIPKDIVGVGLCIETISHFKEEEEIILPPLSKLKLTKIDDDAVYYHTDEEFFSKIKKKYEFTYINNSKKIEFPKEYIDNNDTNKIIDFLEIDKSESYSVEEKIKYFVNHYVNELYQFDVVIGDETYTLCVEWYDSTSVYKDFYSVTNNSGFSIYTIYKDYILFFIEIGEDNNGNYMHVDYFFRFSTKSNSSNIERKDYILFLSSIGYYFGIDNIKIYCEYFSCNLKDNTVSSHKKNNIRDGNYCKDFYNYLKHGKNYIIYNIDSIKELKPQFSYGLLDLLKTIDYKKILSNKDNDELYQIYQEFSKINNNKNSIADFYIWIVESYCYLLNILVKKFNKIYFKSNPFDNDYYILNHFSFLYNRNHISYIPLKKKNKYIKEQKKIKLPLNRYRLSNRIITRYK